RAGDNGRRPSLLSGPADPGRTARIPGWSAAVRTRPRGRDDGTRPGRRARRGQSANGPGRGRPDPPAKTSTSGRSTSGRISASGGNSTSVRGRRRPAGSGGLEPVGERGDLVAEGLGRDDGEGITKARQQLGHSV